MDRVHEDRRDVIVVTGAGGMGTAIARRLGSGCTLLMADASSEQLDRVVGALCDEGYAALGVVTDVSDRTSVVKLAETAAREGRLAAVVHTAASPLRWRRRSSTRPKCRASAGAPRRSPIATTRPVRYLPWDDEVLAVFAAEGWPPATVEAGYLPSLEEDLRTLDFPDFVLICPRTLADDIAHQAAYRPTTPRSATLSFPPTWRARRSRSTRQPHAPTPNWTTTRSPIRSSGCDRPRRAGS